MLKTNKFNIIWESQCKENINAIKLWKDYILVNSENKSEIHIYDENNGKYLKNLINNEHIFGLKKSQDNLIINDYLFTIDNSLGLCQIFNMFTNKPIAIFGFNNLKMPNSVTGIYENGIYILYISDANTNSIFKYKLQIIDNEIVNLQNNKFISLPNSNLELILIDNKHKRILAFDELNNYIQIFDYNGKIINKINGKIENMVIHGDYYIFNDKSDDSNMLHLFSRDKIKYYTSYYSPVAKNITSIFSDNEYLYIINNYCSIKKIKLQLETNNNKLLLLTIGTLMYKLLS